MKKIYFLIFLLSFIFYFESSYAQPGEWTWIHGSNAGNSAGNFGTQGVPSATNEPPALYEAAEWTDLNGKFWLYGGVDQGRLIHNDLWEYDPLSNEWTWISGTHTTNDFGNYGVKGMPADSNRPPGLGYGADTWTDLDSGNLWIFGGSNLYNYADLWKYNISSNQWTWMKGPGNPGGQTGIYGTQGMPDTANYPPSRSESSASWTDNAGDLWFFGGLGTYNDLWRYTIATNTWTWMKGANARNQQGHWGAKGVENVANVPSARFAYTRWKDVSGNLWLFGGQGYDASYIGGQLGDLWRYNIVTNNWTWMSGSNSAENAPVFGTKCNTASANMPPNRGEARACWTDANGNFWMFGGFDQWSFAQSISLNDVWMYDVASNQWTWENGDTTTSAGNWGTLNVASPSNKPDGRVGSLGWTDHNGHLYLFGGSGSSYHNDLWKYTIDSTCGTIAHIVPIADFAASDSILCAYDCINFTDLSTNATSWQWRFAGALDSTSTAQNPQNVCYQKAGIYNVTLIASAAGGRDSVTFTNYIKVAAAPPTPVITQHHDTLICSTDPSYSSYQWYIDSTLINGATDTLFVITDGGNYNVKVSSENGCSIAAGITVVGIKEFSQSNYISLSPNPATDELLISGNWQSSGEKKFIGIFNVLGEIIYTKELISKQETINCKLFPAGIYFVQVTNENSRWVGRFVKE